MKASFTQDESGIEKYLNGMLTRAKTVSSYLNRNLVQQYQKAQIERFQSENATQQGSWFALNENYARYKKRKFAAAPGGGNVIMIASGKLKSGATASDSSNYYKLVTDDSITIGINLSAIPYARYPGVLRPYMKFTEETLDLWRQGIRDFVIKNKVYQ